jgi:hypothetical protein
MAILNSIVGILVSLAIYRRGLPRWGTVGGQDQGRRPACPRHAGTASMAALRAGHENLSAAMAIARPVQAFDVFSARLAKVS